VVWKGIYTTKSMKFGHRYALAKVKEFEKAKGPSEVSKKPALLICAIVPGNIFPVVEEKKYYGHSGVDGYQSHYVVGNTFSTISFVTSQPYSFFCDAS